MRSLITQVLGPLSAVFLPDSRMGNACPTAIRQTVPSQPGAEFPTMESIHAAMLTCPSIETLQVRVAAMGCTEEPDRYNFPFNPRGNERYASAPRVLSLDGYDTDATAWDIFVDKPFWLPWYERLGFWVERGRAVRWLLYRLLPEERRLKTNLDMWLDAMDFSQIHTLHLNYTRGTYVLTDQVIQKLVPRLTGLESLVVHEHIAERFILALPKDSLKHLSWQNPQHGRDLCEKNDECESLRSPLESILQQHGSSLESLEYHTQETPALAAPALSIQELHHLATLAPNLQSLTIDLTREVNGTESVLHWPWEKLKMLAAGLPELTELTIYFELASDCQRQTMDPWTDEAYRCDGQCIEPDRYARPLLGKTSGAEIVRFLLQHKAGKKLERVAFRAGDWAAPWDGALAVFSWLDWKRSWVTCHTEDLHSEGWSEESWPINIICDAGDTLALDEWEEYCH